MSSIWNDEAFGVFLEACGGKDNILEVENCTTRLRVGLKNTELEGQCLYNKDKLGTLPGVKMVLVRGNSIQLVVGLDVFNLEKECRERLEK